MKVKYVLLTGVVLFLSAALAVPPLSAQTAESIIQRLEENIVHSSSRIEGSMTVTDRFGEKTTSFISWSEGEDNVLIEFTSIEEEGQKILRTEDEIYLFYPDAEELIRLRGAALRDSVLGSDMSYEDLTGGKGILETYTVTLEGEEPVEGTACYKLVLTAKARNVPYPKQILWVDKNDFVYLRMEQYALSGRLLKELRVIETKQIKGKTVPTKMIIADAMKKRSSTEFTISDIRIGLVLPSDLFSLQELTW
jgi:outer membrane lipoprotein-sorting protein